jgi:2-polyprenyl-3-methyl-5-hydroxy-6-metoxy-1,4-benzoquinol methylase
MGLVEHVMAVITRDSKLILNKNLEHYEKLYERTKVEELIAKFHDLKNFLADALITDTKWHGIYLDGFADQIKGKKVLELGCGNGLNALIMAALGAYVVALDISPRSAWLIEEASKRLALTTIESHAGDFLQIPFDNDYFDYIIGKDFLHHLTHELETDYLGKVASLLKANGQARFLEPVENSKVLEIIKYMVPVQGRPSIFCRQAFATWRENVPHPIRDNSSAHYVLTGQRFFKAVEVIFLGSLERLDVLMGNRSFIRPYWRWANRIEPSLPSWFRRSVARRQTIIYRQPIHKPTPPT